jgi:hypothetical protein
MPIEQRSVNSQDLNAGPYLARIVSHLDPKYMGTLQVELLREVGNVPYSTNNLFQVKYLSPFYGVTSLDYTTKTNDYNGTQKSYGFWMIPPDPGTLVLVTFVEGNPKNGYWIGCVQDEYMNFMVPGIAATEINTEKTPSKVPVAEYNKNNADLSASDTTQNKKPVHPLAAILSAQGLLTDEFRGITTSSARREVPSNVFGISTPGPLDRSSGAPKGKVGKSESKISNEFVSRLGGSTFVMDDGDDKFIRKTSASEGPPDYASIENGEKSNEPNIPHNELIRIRTRTGHQILLHNSEDLIYIGNAKGTTWIELTSNGKIDIYANDSISINTDNDLNITAGRDVNIQAGENFNFSAGKGIKITAVDDIETLAGKETKITSGKDTNIASGARHVETAKEIHMNGPAAKTAKPADTPNRIPQHEPWDGHENLNPKEHTPDKTRAGSTAGTGILTKILDTFKKISR